MAIETTTLRMPQELAALVRKERHASEISTINGCILALISEALTARAAARQEGGK